MTISRKPKVRVVRASKQFERKISKAMEIGQRFECVQIAMGLGPSSATQLTQSADQIHEYVIKGTVTGKMPASVMSIARPADKPF